MKGQEIVPSHWIHCSRTLSGEHIWRYMEERKFDEKEQKWRVFSIEGKEGLLEKCLGCEIVKDFRI